MGSFQDLLQSAGYLRDDAALGPIPDLEPPEEKDLDRLYDEIAEEARVEPDSLLLEFVPLPSIRGARSWVQVAVWYDGDLTKTERSRIARVLRERFRVTRPPAAARPAVQPRPRSGAKRSVRAGS
ncbi:MAG: hypothetical protein FJ144_23860 [Deltaproteobacteria bacterium]|nr:hypothetical protein [Deltaproteobacteria bacterium]